MFSPIFAALNLAANCTSFFQSRHESEGVESGSKCDRGCGQTSNASLVAQCFCCLFAQEDEVRKRIQDKQQHWLKAVMTVWSATTEAR